MTLSRRPFQGLAWVVAFAAAVAAMPPRARASGTRLRSMGGILGAPQGGAGAGIGGAALPLDAPGSYLYGWLGIEDEANIFLLPSTLVRYPNRVLLDELQGDVEAFGRSMPRARFGFHYEVAPEAVLAVYGSSVSAAPLRVQPTTSRSTSPYTWVVGDVPNGKDDPARPDLSADFKANVLFAWASKAGRFGASLAVWGDGFNRTEPRDALVEVETFALSARIGGGWDVPGDGSVDVSVGGHWSTFDVRTAQPVGTEPGPGGSSLPPEAQQRFESVELYGPKGNWGVDAAVRGTWRLSGSVRLVPYAAFVFDRTGMAQRFPADADHHALARRFGVEGGIQLAIEPWPGVLIQPAAGMRWDRWSLHTEQGELEAFSRLTLPYFGVGLDARITDWLSLRAGARQFLLREWQRRQTTASNAVDGSSGATSGGGAQDGGAAGHIEERRSYVATTFHVGLGFFIGEARRWVVELDVQPQLLFRGPWVISGQQVAPGTAFDAALSYRW